jgi:hypothetical protein
MLSFIMMAALATVPTVTTGPAERVATSSATVTGTVTPNGAATVYRVEYGTSTSYGLSTGDRNAGAGTAAVSVRVPISGLTPDTDYHYRLVAENNEGIAKGNDATFHTPAPVRPPRVTPGGSFPIGATTVTLRATIRPNHGLTEYHFEYGTTVDFGQRTASRTLGGEAGTVRVAEPLAELRPHTQYHVRLVATNPAGRTVGPERTLFTLRRPTAVSIRVKPRRPVWGDDVTVTGVVRGEGVDGIEVGLERLAFPFRGPFTALGAPVVADASAKYALKLKGLYSSSRLRVVTNTVVGATSRVVRVPVAVKVRLRASHARNGRVLLSGEVRPAASRGRATLQCSHGGRWTRVARTRLASARGSERSRYRFSVLTAGVSRTCRVVVSPRNSSGLVSGQSPRRIVR